MSLTQILLTHSAARQTGMSPFFFSRFNFDRMKEKGNTHYCFHCGNDHGFTLGPNGEATNCDKKTTQDHDPATHFNATIGRANKYTDPWTWLSKEIARKNKKPFLAKLRGITPKEFPYLVTIPQI